VEESFFFVDKGTHLRGFGGAVEAVHHGERDAVFIDGFLGVFFGIYGKRYYANVECFESVNAFVEFS
jgi:hypothetical protein